MATISAFVAVITSIEVFVQNGKGQSPVFSRQPKTRFAEA
jgi:hypothetical protein